MPSLPRHPLSWRSWSFRSILLLLLATLAVRLLWGRHVHRILTAQLEEIHRRGEPVVIEDFAPAHVPDADNAWHYQLRAAQALAPGVTSPRNGNDEFRNYPPYPAFWMKRAQASDQANAKMFALARQARAHTRVQFRDHFTSPMYAYTLPYLNSVRELANTLADGANYAQVRGDDAEAIERIFDLLYLARSLRHDQFFVSELTSIGIDLMALDATQIIAPGLHLSSGSTTRPASPAQIRKLIAQLLDEESDWAQFTRSLSMARLETLDYLRALAEETTVIRPLADAEALRANHYFDVYIRASTQRDFPTVQATLATLEDDDIHAHSALSTLSRNEDRIPRYSRWFDRWSRWGWRSCHAHMLVTVERRTTAVSLAAQLYHADHARWPQSLDELVPAYLPAVPTNPFQAGHHPLGYMIAHRPPPGLEERPLIYFDADKVNPGPIQPECMYGWQQTSTRYQGIDAYRQYRDLTRFVPPPPSTQAVQGNPNQSNTPGNNRE
jgi:hypothetical protein